MKAHYVIIGASKAPRERATMKAEDREGTG